MNVGQYLERIMGMDDATWMRHANPWSGWSRVSILPLFALAVWSRVWIGWWALIPVAVVIAWTWINPRVFGPPVSTENWMSQGVLGERIWLARNQTPIPRHHDQTARLLNIAAGLAALAMILGLIQLNASLTWCGMIACMGAKLWFLDRMVWLKSDFDRSSESHPYTGGNQSEYT